MAVNMSMLVDQFRRVFPNITAGFIVKAPGRVNLIGEHVDYNDGFVLPIAMSQALYVVVGPADDGMIAVHTTAFDQTIRFPAQDPGPPTGTTWDNYVRGTAQMLLREEVPLRAGRLFVHSEVPVGGGTSSSAALEVGTGLALLALAGRTMEPVPLALLARQAEHQYANSPCGIMDQFICVLGRRDHALLLDCRSRTYEYVPMTGQDTTLMVMNTQVKHLLGTGEYAARQGQCQEGLAVLKRSFPRINSLRDVTLPQLLDHQDRLPLLTFRRCRHVVSEIERTRQAAETLKQGDLIGFGRLMNDSHVSLRDDYEVSCKELNALVDIAGNIRGVYGARMTGAGFGGCAIALIRRDAEMPLREAICRHYDSRFEKPAIVYATTSSEGAGIQKIV